MCVGVYPGYGVLPPDLAAASMAHLAGLGSLSPGGLAYARAAMVCSAFICTISYCRLDSDRINSPHLTPSR